MSEYRYKLERKSKKHLCPDCGKRRFVRYVDTVTNGYLPEQYGRCDREENCMYHLNPYKDEFVKRIWLEEQGKRVDNYQQFKPFSRRELPTKPKPVFYPSYVFEKTLEPDRYSKNTFIQNLLNTVPFPFETGDVERVVSLYYLGTVSKGYRSGAITFPFIDKANNIRAIQVKQFDQANHTKGTDFLHSIVEKHYTRTQQALPEWLGAYLKQDKRVSCLFGEHLLNRYPFNPIALVEAPKTAIYGTLYFGFPEQPENFLWMGVYNLSSLTFEKCKSLHGRDVYLFPDLSKTGHAYNQWSEKAKQFQEWIPGTKFTISDLLEKAATEAEKAKGLDLADYLIKQDWRAFKLPMEPTESKQLKPSECEKREKCECLKKTFFSLPEQKSNKILINKHGYPASWD